MKGNLYFELPTLATVSNKKIELCLWMSLPLLWRTIGLDYLSTVLRSGWRVTTAHKRPWNSTIKFILINQLKRLPKSIKVSVFPLFSPCFFHTIIKVIFWFEIRCIIINLIDLLRVFPFRVLPSIQLIDWISFSVLQVK